MPDPCSSTVQASPLSNTQSDTSTVKSLPSTRGVSLMHTGLHSVEGRGRGEGEGGREGGRDKYYNHGSYVDNLPTAGST